LFAEINAVSSAGETALTPKTRSLRRRDQGETPSTLGVPFVPQRATIGAVLLMVLILEAEETELRTNMEREPDHVIHRRSASRLSPLTEADVYASTTYFVSNSGTDDPEQMQSG
jgi:hypothetical protein